MGHQPGACDNPESGTIWYGKLTEDVVYTHTRVPKKPGSNKFTTVSRPQDAHLSTQWLEYDGLEQCSETVYSWDDKGFVDTACPAHSLLCRVDFTRFENDSGAEQYVLAETEAFRIKSLALAPDSTSEGSDSSSDGVEDDCAINVAQVQAT